MSWKVHETDEVFAALRGLCSNSYRMYDPSEYRYYYDHECDAYECAVEDAAKEYERLLRHCDHQRKQLALYEEGGRTMNERVTNDERESGAGITDELRAGGKHAPVSDTRWFGEDELAAIADRIDKEHAEAVERARMDGMDATFGDGWVKLPVDADGVPIHVGDRMAFEDGEEFDVKGFGGSRAERLFYLNENGRFCWGIAENCRHVKPDSWERVVRDIRTMKGCGSTDEFMERHCAELVERCRRLAGERG